jgi:hypothetical protein
MVADMVVVRERKAWAEKSPASEGRTEAFVENEEVFMRLVLRNVDSGVFGHT